MSDLCSPQCPVRAGCVDGFCWAKYRCRGFQLICVIMNQKLHHHGNLQAAGLQHCCLLVGGPSCSYHGLLCFSYLFVAALWNGGHVCTALRKRHFCIFINSDEIWCCRRCLVPFKLAYKICESPVQMWFGIWTKLCSYRCLHGASPGKVGPMCPVPGPARTPEPGRTRSSKVTALPKKKKTSLSSSFSKHVLCW